MSSVGGFSNQDHFCQTCIYYHLSLYVGIDCLILNKDKNNDDDNNNNI